MIGAWDVESASSSGGKDDIVTIAPVRLAAFVLLAGAAATAAWTQTIPTLAPDRLAARLRTATIEPGSGFRASRQTTCIPHRPGSDWAYHCVTPMADAARGGRTAALEIMIFDRGYSVAGEDAKLQAAVARMPGRWALSYQTHTTLSGKGREISLHGLCRQSRGAPNSPAFCLLPVTANVLVFTQVAPAQPRSDSVTTGSGAGGDSFADMDHAGHLATIGATMVAEATVR